jgi:hypothetical protein
MNEREEDLLLLLLCCIGVGWENVKTSVPIDSFWNEKREREIHSRCANFERHHSDNRFAVHSALFLSLSLIRFCISFTMCVVWSRIIWERERERVSERDWRKKRFFRDFYTFFFSFSWRWSGKKLDDSLSGLFWRYYRNVARASEGGR